MDRSSTLRPAALVGAGAALGALARWSIAELIDADLARIPWETLLVNVVGCLAIGVAAMRLEPGSDRWAFLVTGVLGGFTTFSTFANETRVLIDDGRTTTAVCYVVITVLAGLAAVSLGRWRTPPSAKRADR